jgi:hypothetical protein
MMGQQVIASKHAVLPFGANVQTHKQHSNDMGQCTLSCIFLGPTGNMQGGHWFMSLTSGERLIRYQWTELPMPNEAITCINNIGKRQGIPTLLTYANRYRAKLPETLGDYPSSSDKDDSNDDTYSPPEISNDDSNFSVDTDDYDDSNSTSSNSDHDMDNDDHDHLDLPHNNHPHPAEPPLNQGVDNTRGAHHVFALGQELPGYKHNPEGGSALNGDKVSTSTSETNDNDDNVSAGEENRIDVNESENNDDESEEDEIVNRFIESDAFEAAVRQGREHALLPYAPRPRRLSKYQQHDESYVTAQMSAKKD